MSATGDFPRAESSISGISIRPLSAHASAEPTSTGLMLMVSVCGRDAMAQARSDVAKRIRTEVA